MPNPGCPAMSAAQDVAKQFFDEETESFGAEAVDAAINSKQYGPTRPKGKELTKRVISDPKVRKAFKKAKSGMKKKKGLQLSKAIEQWLTKITNGVWTKVTLAGRGWRKAGNNSATSIPVGGITATGRSSSAEGSALAAAQEGKGPYMYFELYEEGIHACAMLLRAAAGEEVEAIHNVYLFFDPGRILEIAMEQAGYLLELLAAESNCSVKDILGGRSLEDVIHRMSFEDAEKVAMDLGKKQAKGRNAKQDANHIGALRFQTLANLKIFVDDIVTDLESGKCAAVPLKDGYGPYCFPTVFEARILVQNCHGGGTAAQGLDPVTEYEREWITEAYRYLIDKYGADGYVIDMKAESNDDNDSAISVKVPIPKEDTGENGGSFARLLNLENPTVDHGHTTFHVKMSQGDGGINRTHHQILQQVLTSSGKGMKNHAGFNEFLGGKTFEEKYPFSAKTQERYEKLFEDYWQEKYPGIEFAEWCDVDHCVGRSKRWMNNVLFTNLCSHRWNSCMAAVRIAAGDWCFGLGTKAYGNGND